MFVKGNNQDCLVATSHSDSAATPGGSDMAGADREDLEQLERAVRGRLLEVQILKLSAQCRAAQGQFENYLDMASSAAKPKVKLCSHQTAFDRQLR